MRGLWMGDCKKSFKQLVDELDGKLSVGWLAQFQEMYDNLGKHFFDSSQWNKILSSDDDTLQEVLDKFNTFQVDQQEISVGGFHQNLNNSHNTLHKVLMELDVFKGTKGDTGDQGDKGERGESGDVNIFKNWDIVVTVDGQTEFDTPGIDTTASVESISIITDGKVLIGSQKDSFSLVADKVVTTRADFKIGDTIRVEAMVNQDGVSAINNNIIVVNNIQEMVDLPGSDRAVTVIGLQGDGHLFKYIEDSTHNGITNFNKWERQTNDIPHPFWIGVKGEGADEGLKLQEFFDWILSSETQNFTWQGKWKTSIPLTIKSINSSPGYSKLNSVECNVELRSLEAMEEPLLTISGCAYTKFTGELTLFGKGNLDWGNKVNRDALRFIKSANAKLDTVTTKIFYRWGVNTDSNNGGGNNGDIHIRSLYNYDCGAYKAGQEYMEARTVWSNPINSGIESNLGQRTEITVERIQKGTEVDGLLMIGETCHIIKSIDTQNQKIEVYPWIDTTLNGTDNIAYGIIGGGVFTGGGDGGILKVDNQNSMRCGVAHYSGALYGNTIGVLIAQACGASLAIGRKTNSAHRGFCVNSLYSEINNFDILLVASSSMNTVINQNYAVNWEKVRGFNPRKGDDTIDYSVYNNWLAGITISDENYIFKLENEASSKRVGTQTLKLKDRGNRDFIRDSASSNFTLKVEDVGKRLNELFGIHTIKFSVTTNSENTTYIGYKIRFKSTEGWTVEGVTAGTNFEYNPTKKFTSFTILADFKNKNWIVNAI